MQPPGCCVCQLWSSPLRAQILLFAPASLTPAPSVIPYSYPCVTPKAWSGFLCVKMKITLNCREKKTTNKPLPAMLHAGFASHPKSPLHPERTLYRFLPWHDFHPSLLTAPTCLVVWDWSRQVWKNHIGLNIIRLILKAQELTGLRKQLPISPWGSDLGAWRLGRARKISAKQNQAGWVGVFFFIILGQS